MKNRPKTILFLMASAYGHLNCTFALAKRLQLEGYRIVYVANTSKIRYLEKQGFEVIDFDPQLFSFGLEMKFAVSGKVDSLLHQLVDRISDIRLQKTAIAVNRLNEVMDVVRPDLIFIDAFYPYLYLFIEEKVPPVVFLNIMLATQRRENIPPLNSISLPAQGGLGIKTIMNNLEWWKYYANRYGLEISSLGQSQLGISRRLLKKKAIDIKKRLNHERVFYPSIMGQTEWILGPRSLDYDEITPVNQVYLASPVHDPGVYTTDNLKLEVLLDCFKAKKDGKPLVYCSLGTLNVRHNPACIAFFSKVIQVFKQNKGWEVIISTGEIDPRYFGFQPPNVHLFKRVPQLEILKHSQVMITHGGINSLLECIDTETPMLVFPLNDDWDQNGNAARVVHYGLGMQGELEKTTTEAILDCLRNLVEDDNYLKCVQLMKKRIEQEDGIDRAISDVSSMLCPSVQEVVSN